eukprot:10229647-Karenia_brevis.AAC.1
MRSTNWLHKKHDEKLAACGLRWHNWPYVAPDNRKIYVGEDMISGSFTLREFLQIRWVVMSNGRQVLIHSQPTPEYDNRLKEGMKRFYNRFPCAIYGHMLRPCSLEIEVILGPGNICLHHRLVP